MGPCAEVLVIHSKDRTNDPWSFLRESILLSFFPFAERVLSYFPEELSSDEEKELKLS